MLISSLNTGVSAAARLGNTICSPCYISTIDDDNIEKESEKVTRGEHDKDFPLAVLTEQDMVVVFNPLDTDKNPCNEKQQVDKLNGAILLKKPVGKSSPCAQSWSHDGKLFAVGFGRLVQVYSRVEKGELKLIRTLVYDSNVRDIACCAYKGSRATDNFYWVAIGGARGVKVVCIDRTSCSFSSEERSFQPITLARSHPISVLAFSQDQPQQLLVGATDGHLGVWDTKCFERGLLQATWRDTVSMTGGRFTDASFASSDGSLFVLASWKHGIFVYSSSCTDKSCFERVWRLKRECEVAGQQSEATQAVFSRDGSYLFSYMDGKISVHCVSRRVELWSLGLVSCVGLSLCGEQLMACLEDGTIKRLSGPWTRLSDSPQQNFDQFLHTSWKAPDGVFEDVCSGRITGLLEIKPEGKLFALVAPQALHFCFNDFDTGLKWYSLYSNFQGVCAFTTVQGGRDWICLVNEATIVLLQVSHFELEPSARLELIYEQTEQPWAVEVFGWNEGFRLKWANDMSAWVRVVVADGGATLNEVVLKRDKVADLVIDPNVPLQCIKVFIN